MVCKPAAANMPQNALLTCHSPGEKAQIQHHTAQRNKKALVESGPFAVGEGCGAASDFLSRFSWRAGPISFDGDG